MNTRKFSNFQEKMIAKSIQGRKQPNSGATPFKKGDVITDKILIEAKTTTKDCKSFSIKKEWLEKNKQEAISMGKQFSVLAFNFESIASKNNYYIIDERLFKELIDYVQREE